MKKLVFVVEDNPVQQKMLQVHFEQMLGDYTVQTFTDPDNMFAHLAEKPFAIVLDHYFEGKTKTGLDYLKEIRKKHPHMAVIYHTSLDDDDIREQAQALGITEYIIKNSASLVRLRTSLDILIEQESKKGFFKRLFG